MEQLPENRNKHSSTEKSPKDTDSQRVLKAIEEARSLIDSLGSYKSKRTKINQPLLFSALLDLANESVAQGKYCIYPHIGNVEVSVTYDALVASLARKNLIDGPLGKDTLSRNKYIEKIHPLAVRLEDSLQSHHSVVSIDRKTDRYLLSLPLPQQLAENPESDHRKLKEQAWKAVPFPRVCEDLVTYYEQKKVRCFSYEHNDKASIKVPLYVRPEWESLSNSDVKIVFSDSEPAFTPSNDHKEFLDFYIPFFKRDKEWNDRIFRLTNINTVQKQLQLDFVLGRFWDSFACQYILEHETRLAIARGNLTDRDMPLRGQFANSADSVEHFCKQNVARMGISNLILLKKDRNSYIPLVSRRGNLSMGEGYDTISSGIFSVVTTPRADMDPMHKVLEEVYEELYGGLSMEHEQKTMNPRAFYEKPPIRDLCKLLDKGTAVFDITGFCIDLVRIVPDLTCILIVNDPAYYRKYKNQFQLNSEYHTSSQIEVPANLDNLHSYLRCQFPSDLDSEPAKIGFDPRAWSLPGGFCFYQGMKKAITKKLL